MDPKAAWETATAAAKAYIASEDVEDLDAAMENASAMAQAVADLDEWIGRGGFCPFCAVPK